MEEPISATGAARAELASLRDRHGPLILFLSGGCCEGSSPLCLHEGELLRGPNDLFLGEVDGTPLYVDADQYDRWNKPTLVLDLSDGPSDTFSLEGPDGVHFLARTLPAATGAGGPPAPPS